MSYYNILLFFYPSKTRINDLKVLLLNLNREMTAPLLLFIRSLIFSGQDLSIYDNLGPQKYTLLSSGLWNLVTKLSRFCLENKYPEQKVHYFVNELSDKFRKFYFSKFKVNLNFHLETQFIAFDKD